jgi:D-hydroxyproline dehydrogenase subunit beta
MTVLSATRTPDVIVVGAGIVGAACAAALSARGRKVLVLDAGLPAAYRVAAGLLLLQSKRPGPFLDLGRRSLALLSELPPTARERVGFARRGSLMLVASEEDQAFARAQAETLAAAGVDLDWLKGPRVRQLEPGLGPEVREALFCTEDAQVCPEALRDWWLEQAINRGCRIVEGARVGRLLRRGDRVRGVLAAGGTYHWAENVVLAAGAWSSPLARSAGLELNIRPRGGLLLRGRTSTPLARRPLLGAEYLRAKFEPVAASVAFSFIQRENGEWLLGGTREFGGFSVSAGREVVEQVRACGQRYLPALSALTGTSVLTGFRPWCAAGLPQIGPTEVPGLFVACGHEGDGVMLAAATAERLAASLP